MISKCSHLKLSRIAEEFKFVGFSKFEDFNEAIRSFLNGGPPPYWFALCSPSVYSLVVPSSLPISAEKEEPGWIAVTTHGPMPFGSVQGLISTISSTLKAHGIGVCVISAYSCDFFLIRASKFETAAQALKQDGWEFI